MAEHRAVQTPAQLYALIRQPIKDWLASKFEQFINKLDDALFVQAEQCTDYRLQQEYADAIRALRHQQVSIARHQYKADVLRACETYLLDPETYLTSYVLHGGPVTQADQHKDFSLLEDQALEEELAITRISQAALNRNLAQLNELVGLIYSIQPRIEPRAEQLPFSPLILTSLFLRELSDWQYDPKVKFFACEVFAQDFLVSCDDFYAHLIELFKQVGLRGSVMLKKYRQAGLDYSHSNGSERVDSATLFGAVVMMRQLGMKQRARLGLPSRFLKVQPGNGHGSQQQTRAAITTLIREMQKVQAKKPPTDLIEARKQQASSLRGLEQTVSEKQYPVRTLDVQIIDVISMLFNFILDDPVLPARMKVLLVRLQMPVLRVAVDDKSFLTDREHPARVLLNNFAQASVKCAQSGDLTKNHLDLVIENLIQKILENYDGDIELFSKVNAEFQEFIAREERSARMVEERLIDAARGREQLLLARQQVDHRLKQMLPKQIAEAAFVLIKDAWRDVMTLALLREGESSLAWKKSVEICEHLIDSVIPKAQPAVRRQRILEIPTLLNELRRGMSSISYDNTKANALLTRLQRCHIICMRGLPPGRVVTIGEDPFADESENELLEDEFTRTVRRLKIGQWVAWRTIEGKERRGKLIWRSQQVDLLLFVDARGRKLAEMNSKELADYFRKGDAIVLARINEPLMERALQSIYSTLMPSARKKLIPQH